MPTNQLASKPRERDMFCRFSFSRVFLLSFLPSSSTRERFYSQRPSALAMPWPRVSSLPRPSACLHFYRAKGSAFPLSCSCSSIFIEFCKQRSRAFRPSICCKKKSLRALRCIRRDFNSPRPSTLAGMRSTYYYYYPIGDAHSTSHDTCTKRY